MEKIYIVFMFYDVTLICSINIFKGEEFIIIHFDKSSVIKVTYNIDFYSVFCLIEIEIKARTENYNLL